MKCLLTNTECDHHGGEEDYVVWPWEVVGVYTVIHYGGTTTKIQTSQLCIGGEEEEGGGGGGWGGGGGGGGGRGGGGGGE